jgi:UDP-N-acetyl-D-glucosamine dehydrogenase
LIINESTSYPGTLRNFIKPRIDKVNLLNLEFASAPERVDPSNEYWNITNTPRVISGLTNNATNRAVEFYSSFCNKVHQVTSPEIAEASKVFENTFRQVNIALSNEFSLVAQSLGFSGNEAIQAASTKPFGFMPFYPSIGVGGHCIPIDPTYLSYAASLVGIETKIINVANSINTLVTHEVANRIRSYLGGSLSGLKIQIAGIAYKADVSDIRESPALSLINELQILGAQVCWFDPLVSEFNGVKSEPLDANIDLGLIVTPHKQIDFSIWLDAKTRVLDLSSNAQNYGWPKFL